MEKSARMGRGRLRLLVVELWMLAVLGGFFVLRVWESQTVQHILGKVGATHAP
jgi:hypothetical protein